MFARRSTIFHIKTSRASRRPNRLLLLLHQVARVRFDHQPHFFAGFELQGIAGGEGEVDFHLDAALYARGDDYVASLKGCDAARNYVAGA